MQDEIKGQKEEKRQKEVKHKDEKSPSLLEALPQIVEETKGEVVAHIERESPSSLKDRINDFYLKMEREYPDYPAEKRDVLFNLVVGPLQMNRETLVDNRTEEIGKYEAEILARLRHSFVHHIVDISNPKYPPDPKFIEAMYVLYNNMDICARLLGKKETDALPIIWEDMRNETAVVRALLEAGYQVYVPDYSQPISDDDVNETLQLDTESGIAILAVSPAPDDDIYAIGVKGSERVEKARTARASRPKFHRDRRNPRERMLREAIADIAYENKIIEANNPDDLRTLNGLSIIRTSLVIPTGGSHFELISQEVPGSLEEKEKILNSFGVLKSDDGKDIISSLDALSRDGSVRDRFLE